MNALKEYKPITLVFYIDWNGERNALPLDNTKREAFKKAVENNKMVELEWTVINTFDIKEVRPAEKLSEIEKIYYSLPRNKRAYLNRRVKVMAWDNKAKPVEYFTSRVNQEKAIQRMLDMVAYFEEEHLDQ